MIKKLLILTLICIAVITTANAQAPGNTCATAVTLPLPTIGNTINTGPRSVELSGNNYTGFVCLSANYGGGPDGVYRIDVPVGGGHYNFAYTAGNDYKSFSIHTACAPTTGNCIGGFTTGSGTTGDATYFLDAGTYYLLIDNWPDPVFALYTLVITRLAPPTSYCNPAPTSVDGQGITNVSFSTVNNTTVAEAGNYGNYSSQVGTALEGTTLPVNITYKTGYTYNTTIWVDWNDDFVFSTSEVVYTGESTGANPTTLAASFVIPAGTATSGNGTGLHRMRIGGKDFGPITEPCHTGTYACFEDYSLQVIVPATPTITSLSGTAGCVGTSLTITGTNLTAASSVTIGGTAATITTNTATSITVTVGNGTTGTVAVTTPGGIAVSTATFTVNTLPANPPNTLTSDSPQCNPPGVTVSHPGTAPTGETWYWQTAANGTSTANNAATPIVVPTSRYVYIRAQNNATGCWSNGTRRVYATVNLPITAIASTPTPANNAIGVCYAGASPISLISWGIAANATGYNVYFGTTPTPPLVSTAQTDRTYATGTLLANTTYYWRIVPTNACGATAGTVVTWSFTTANGPCHCIPTATYTSDYISSFSTTGGITNINNSSNGMSGTGYGDFYDTHSATQIAGSSLNFTETYNGGSHGFSIWVDLNKNGTFETSERLYNATTTATGFNGTIAIPSGTTAGDYRMRVRAWYGNLNPDPCANISFGEAEDYKLKIIVPVTPTITALSSSEGCTGSSLTITGTDFLAVSAVRIGGTLATVTANTATSITVTVGTGTTGTVSVTTPGGTANSAITFTVNALPGNPPAPTSNSPQCNPPGVTLTRNGTQPTGVTWYWQTTAAGTSTVNSNLTYLATSSGTYYLRAQNNATGCWSTGSGARAVVVNTTTPNLATGPNPVNNANGICYAGTSPLTSISWGGGVNATNYDVYFGTTPVPPLVANRTVRNYPTGTLAPNTTYYWRIVPKNTCGDTTGTTVTWRFTTANGPCICIPTNTSSTSYFISGITTSGGVADINNTGTGFSAYTDYTSQFVSQYPGSNFNITATHPSSTYGYNVWIDWNGNGNFDDVGENVISTGYLNSPATLGSITILGSQAPGNYRMRIRNAYLNNPAPACGSHNYGEAEDYTVTVLTLNCIANPQALTAISTTTNTATISWTHASPLPGNGYEYIISTDNSTSTPVGDIIGTTTGNTIPLTGLAAGTTYYVFVRGVCNAVYSGAWITTIFTTGCADTIDTPTCGVIAGGVGLNGANPPQINCDTGGCTDLEVEYLKIGNTASYRVEQIPYNPPPTGSLLAISGLTDDYFSSAINLPWDFCFYGTPYNSFVYGANGVISFDSALLANQASGYRTYNNIPTAENATDGRFYGPSIFGVHHDINPSKGSPTIGRRIDTTPGCESMIIVWENVPMFYTNSILYSGKMVIYKDTNIIEIYVQEKRIDDGDWNDGNAAIALQGNATTGIAAPCRNTLSPNWTAVNEAWRFVPDAGDITSVAWYEGVDTSGPLVGTTDIISVCPTGTTTYTAAVTYTPACGDPYTRTDQVTVTSGNKVWNGSESTNWYVPNNWTPTGIPTAEDCIVIPASSTTNGRSPVVDISGTPPLPPPPALAKSVLVRNNGTLEVNANAYLQIVDALDVQANGDVLIRDSGSLIQITDVTTNNNTGNIRMQREVLGVGAQNYVYWSSPVEGFNVGNINMAASEPKWQWEPTTTDIYGNWTAASGTMTVGRGYIVRGLATPPSPIPPNNAEFLGRPSNGVINVPITRGNYTGIPYAGASPNTQATNLDDNWNLVGNPYPSAISGSAFITENATGTTPKIDGIIYLWNHAGLPVGTTGQDPFYGNYVYNYLGSSYVAFNGTGSNPPIFNGSIAAGQSFFVQMEDGAGMNNTVLFNNGMRSVTQANDDFLRTTERHRIWLDLVNSSNEAISTLVGYVMEATNDKDRLYDGNDLNDTPIQFYSLLGTDEMTIQGRALPLDQEDRVPLGIVVPQNANYKIAINSVDGLFSDSSQNIYLEDTYLNTIHDLRLNPYEFTSESGTFNDRFILRYTNETLSTPDQVANFGFNIIGLKDYIKVTSGNSPISTVKVYDVLGRLLADYKDVNALEFKFELINQSEGALIVKATLYNGQQKIKKVIY